MAAMECCRSLWLPTFPPTIAGKVRFAGGVAAAVIGTRRSQGGSVFPVRDTVLYGMCIVRSHT